MNAIFFEWLYEGHYLLITHSTTKTPLQVYFMILSLVSIFVIRSKTFLLWKLFQNTYVKNETSLPLNLFWKMFPLMGYKTGTLTRNGLKAGVVYAMEYEN